MKSFFIILVSIFFLIGCSNPYYSGPETDHFDGVKFYNSTPPANHGLLSLLKWMLNRKIGEWPKEDIKVYAPKLRKREHGSTITATYINHATVLIQTKGLNILIDPVWSERVSPISWYGPKRVHTMPVAIKDLPPIDIVLISHSHYDHLDTKTLQELQKLYNPIIYAGLGVDKLLKSKDINARSFDWWDYFDAGRGVRIHFVPAQHWSSRWMWDKNYTLWGGFVIDTNLGAVYFAGDSGYCKEYFKSIAKRFPKIKLAFIPIGAYKPKWFMKYSHMDPEEAVKTSIDINAYLSIAIQFDSFRELADEGYGEAIKDLKRALKKYNIKSSKFIALTPGSTVSVSLNGERIKSSCIETSSTDHSYTKR